MTHMPQDMGSIQHHTSIRMPNAAGDSTGPNAPSGANGINTVARVFVERDYRAGVGIRFMTDFPQQELGGRVSKILFLNLFMVQQYIK